MTIIHVSEMGWDIKSLYSNADTKAKRGLMGYMMRTGRSDDLVFGGAFALVRDIEAYSCHGNVYKLSICSPRAKEIIAIAETAMAGGFDKFAFSKREIRRIGRRINDIL